MEVCAADRDEFDGEEHYTSHMWQLPHCRSLWYCALACLFGIDRWFPWVLQAADAGVCVCVCDRHGRPVHLGWWHVCHYVQRCWCWKANSVIARNAVVVVVVFRYGKLGHGSETGHSRPSRVEALSGTVVTQIACGSRHTVALTGVDWRGRRMRV